MANLKEDMGTITIDLMYCNGRPVFSSVVIGSTFLLATSKFYKSVGFLKRTRSFLGSFLKLRPFRLEITKKDDSKLKTAVSGIVVVPYRTDSLLSRFIPEKAFFNDGMLHALLICPRSILELIGYAFRSIWQKSKLPGLGAHIKTDKIRFGGPEGELSFTEDGDSHAAGELELEIKKRHLEIVPGALLTLPEETPASNEIFRTGALPTGEAAIELCRGKLPLLRRASTEEFKDLFQILRDNARLKGSYLVLMVLSTVLATLGLFADSAPVVIGAMILAPLMAPIISLSMASLLLVTNLAGMVLAGSLTFIVLGFSPFRLATRGVFISLVIVIIFSVPLGFGFGHMIEEHNVVRRLDGWQTEDVTLRDVRVRTVRPLSLSVTLVSRQPLDPDELDGAKARIEERLGREVQMEISTALER